MKVDATVLEKPHDVFTRIGCVDVPSERSARREDIVGGDRRAIEASPVWCVGRCYCWRTS